MSTKTRREKLYEKRQARLARRSKSALQDHGINSILENLPKYSEKDMKEVERLVKKIDVEFNEGGDKRMLENVRTVERFMREVIYPEFDTEPGRKEARSFTIAVLADIGAIPTNLLDDLVKDEQEIIYTKLALVYISNGRAESTYVDNFEDVADPVVVRKTFNILSKFNSITESSAYDTIKLMVDQLPSVEDNTDTNPKNLPAIIEESYHSINPEDPGIGQIARNDWYELEKIFGEVLTGFKYTFFKIIDPYLNIKVTIFRLYDATGLSILADRIIDEGAILGLSTSLEVPVFVDGRLDSMFCNIARHPEIVRWSLMNPQSAIPEMYRLAICDDMLSDPRAYFYIDFSEQSIDSFTDTDKTIFNNNLVQIFNMLWNNNIPMYRMTLTEYANPNKFELVSDKETMCHKDSCRDIAPIDTIIRYDNGIIEILQNEKRINLSEVAEGQSVYGPRMNGLFGGLIIR